MYISFESHENHYYTQSVLPGVNFICNYCYKNYTIYSSHFSVQSVFVTHAQHSSILWHTPNRHQNSSKHEFCYLTGLFVPSTLIL